MTDTVSTAPEVATFESATEYFGAQRADEWRCHRCSTKLQSPGDGRPPADCSKDSGGCGRLLETCPAHTEEPDENCPWCSKGATMFVPAEWGEGKVALIVDYYTAPLTRMVRRLEHVYRFRRREDAVLVLLWAAQAHLGPAVLPSECVVYVVFTGPKSAGKTYATKIAVYLGSGDFIPGGSEAAIRRKLSTRAPCLGVDEVDIRIKSVPELEGMLRVGNSWDAKYTIMVPKAKGQGWEPLNLDIGGPKAFNYRNDPEDALASRTLEVECCKCSDSRLVAESLFFPSAELTAIRDELAEVAEDAKEAWPAERMKAHILDPAFLARAEALNASLPRGMQIGMVLLAVADAMGFDAESVIAGYIAEERVDSLGQEREILADIYREHAPDAQRGLDGTIRLKNKDLFGWMNARLKDLGQPPIPKSDWPRTLRELGLERKKSNGPLWILFPEKTREALVALGSDKEGAG